MPHTEPDYPGNPSLGCLWALSLTAGVVLVLAAGYWLLTTLF